MLYKFFLYLVYVYKQYISAQYIVWNIGSYQLIIIISYITEPNAESGANVDAAIMWRERREEFNEIARRLVRKTLGIPS